LPERLLPQAAAQDLLLAAAGEIPVRQVSASSRHPVARAFTSPQRQQGKLDIKFRTGGITPASIAIPCWRCGPLETWPVVNIAYANSALIALPLPSLVT
jgi:hypothetical protein